MIQIPCGHTYCLAKPPYHVERCAEDSLCPNCTALRGLTAALAVTNVAEAEAAYDEWARGHPHRKGMFSIWLEGWNQSRAALAAARPAEEK
jgi:hypothetical protein